MAQLPIMYVAILLIVVIIAIIAVVSVPRGGAATTSMSTTTATGNVSVGVNSSGTSSGTTSAPTTAIASTSTKATTLPTTTIASKGGSLSAWEASSTYPLAIYNETCVGWTDYVYCIGGFISPGNATTNVYYAKVSSQGIGLWKQTAGYTINVSAPSCAVEANTVYCIGGIYPDDNESSEGGYWDSNGNVTGEGFFANLTPDGIGIWHTASGYATPIAGTSCVLLEGNMYCVGGFNGYRNLALVNFTALDNGNYRYWSSTRSYPFNTSLTACVGENITIYCVAGTGSQNDYYDSIAFQSMWLGTWNRSGTYPLPAYDPSCVTGGGSIYCVGGFESNGAPIGNTYYANLSIHGFGSWKTGPSYPSPGLDQGSCVFSDGYLYCVGGLNQDGTTYFTQA
jgi:hypothetical protein